MSNQRLALLIDTKRCIACNSCAVACKIENNLPDGNWVESRNDGWRRASRRAKGEYPDLEMYNVTLSCQHCENPACVKVCPVGATYKDPETRRRSPGLRQMHRLPHVRRGMSLYGSSLL